MAVLAVVVGALIGVLLAHDGAGALFGGAIGWLVARSLQQQRDIVQLREQFRSASLRGTRRDRAPAVARADDAAPAIAAGERATAPPAPSVPPDTAMPAFERSPATAAPASMVDDTAAVAPAAAAAQPPRVASTRFDPYALARDWLLGGNTIVKAGIAILFVGLAFLAKYASEHVTIAVEWRLSAIAAVAIALLGVGWRVRERRSGYAQALQGGAVAVLYLVLFAAFRYYGVLASGPAFVLMALVAAFSAVLAVAQNAPALAAIGAVGGFATPILVSTGGGNFVALFAYYLVLDLGIAAIAWVRTWRALNLIGFFGTFIIATVWGVLRYRVENYATSQGFLIAFFVVFLVITILPSRRTAGAGEANRLDDWVDGTLMFGLPTITFVLQWGLVRSWPYAVALSALVLAAIYVGLAWAMRSRARLAIAFEGNLGVAVVFLTLVMPFAFDASATAGAWALEGAGLIWISLRQNRWLARAAGYALIVLSGAALLHARTHEPMPQAVVNGLVVGASMIAAAALFAALQLQRRLGQAAASALEALAEPMLIAWAVAWLVIGSHWQIDGFVDGRYARAAWIGVASALSVGFALASSTLRWPNAAWPALLHAPVMVLFTLALATIGVAPFDDGGWLAWPIALGAHLIVVQRAAPQWSIAAAASAAHALGAIVLAGVGALQFKAITAGWGDAEGAWSWLGWGLFPALVLVVLTRANAPRWWPLRLRPAAYVQVAGGVIALGLLLWTLIANWSSNGSAAPLPHVPLLNPLDLGIAIALLAVARWAKDHLPASWRRSGDVVWTHAILGAAAFVWLNSMLIRGFHHYGDVAYRMHAWTHSLAVQTGLTLLWSATALALMWRSARAAHRVPWLVGATLLAVVVLKLLLVDQSGTGTVTRIVSFIGVGVLMLVIGYVAPLPARRGAVSEEVQHAQP